MYAYAAACTQGSPSQLLDAAACLQAHAAATCNHMSLHCTCGSLCGGQVLMSYIIVQELGPAAVR